MRKKIPVVLVIYKRTKNIPKILEKIALYKPDTIYIVADGPKNYNEIDSCNSSRRIVEKSITWNCDVYKIYSRSNLGLRCRVVTGLNHVFTKEDFAIILEDDLEIHPSFFTFCETLLKKYANNSKIISISGNNFQFGKTKIKDSYYFSRYVHSWGWATWKRAWKLYDNDMDDWDHLKDSHWLKNVFHNKVLELYWQKIFDMVKDNQFDSWAYRWTYTALKNDMLTIIPNVNLVSNIGYGESATHTRRKSKVMDMKIEKMAFPLKHPLSIKRNQFADKITEQNTYLNKLTIMSLLIKSLIRQIT